MLVRLGITLLVLCAAISFAANPTAYTGPQVCQTCHQEIAVLQMRTAMARTWVSLSTALLPGDFDQRTTEASSGSSYELLRNGREISYRVKTAARGEESFPVQIIMGGTRHGLGFLFRIKNLEGLPLEPAPLVQARYFWSPARGTLLLAPGLQPHVSQSYEVALGLVLSPEFENRCVTCHGQPNVGGAGKTGGVQCETCHGPGWQHLNAVSKRTASSGILNPAKLNAQQSMAICAKCHTGFGRFIDPSPDDLLVANQVTAIEKSECFIQSSEGLTCTTCHNPHRDATDTDPPREACLQCHAATRKQHAAICPISATGNCIQCHMPTVEIGPLHLVDHWIRVHPESAPSAEHDEGLRSQVRPVRAYLRLIATRDAATAHKAQQELLSGNSFYKVARTFSTDVSASIGGYLGERVLAKLEPALAETASHLQYGERSGIQQIGQRWIIIERLPRDFRWEADQLLRKAETLRADGQIQVALETTQQALMIYPQFLKALRFLGTTLAETGEIQRGLDVIKVATHLYPNDAQSLSDFAFLEGALGDHTAEIQAYRRAIELEPDFVAAYLNLGKAMALNGDVAGAVDIFHAGLRVNPLSAGMYAGLADALARRGDAAGAKRARDLAAAIDPSFNSK